MSAASWALLVLVVLILFLGWAIVRAGDDDQ